MAEQAVVDEIRSQRERFVLAMLRASGPSTMTEPEQRQFINGFLSLIEACAAGNDQPRDEYLADVIPGVKASGMPFAYVLSVLSGVLMAGVSVASPANVGWWFDFGRDYTARLVRAWAA